MDSWCIIACGETTNDVVFDNYYVVLGNHVANMDSMSSFLDHGTMYLSVKVWLCLVLLLLYNYTNHGITFAVPGFLKCFLCTHLYMCVCVCLYMCLCIYVSTPKVINN